MNAQKFPIEVKRGGAVAKIYRTPVRGREGYTVAFNVRGERKLRRAKTLSEAKRKAGEVLDKRKQGEIEVLTLKDADKAEYVRAKNALKASGTSIETACKEGLKVKELAERLNTTTGNIHAWFFSTGKKMKGIKKVGPGQYALSGKHQ